VVEQTGHFFALDAPNALVQAVFEFAAERGTSA
jgi:hypothetical protein